MDQTDYHYVRIMESFKRHNKLNVFKNQTITTNDLINSTTRIYYTLHACGYMYHGIVTAQPLASIVEKNPRR